MTLRTSVVVKQGISGVTLTAGTDKTFVNDGQGTNGANVLVDSSNGNLQARSKVITRVTQPVPPINSNALAKLGRADVTMHFPKVGTTGKLYKRPAAFSITFLPEDTEAERVQMKLDFCAVILDGEFDDLFAKVINA